MVGGPVSGPVVKQYIMVAEAVHLMSDRNQESE
jgi:hypothetical protein